MNLNYPPFVVLSTHFRVTGGHDLNPTSAALQGEDQQLFGTFDAIAVQVMTASGVSSDLRPVVVSLASMAPGVSPIQRVQLATLFVKNAMAALNNPSPALAEVMLPAATPGRKGSRAKNGRRSSRARRSVRHSGR